MGNMNTTGFTIGVCRATELESFNWVVFDETFTVEKLSQLVDAHNDGLINAFDIFEFKRASDYLGKINYGTLGLRRIRPGTIPENEDQQ